MKLLNTPLFVYRTSFYSDASEPCNGAHRHGDKWIISFKTVEELEKFLEENGDVILFPPDSTHVLPERRTMGEIEIYDDYRE